MIGSKLLVMLTILQLALVERAIATTTVRRNTFIINFSAQRLLVFLVAIQ